MEFQHELCDELYGQDWLREFVAWKQFHHRHAALHDEVAAWDSWGSVCGGSFAGTRPVLVLRDTDGIYYSGGGEDDSLFCPGLAVAELWFRGAVGDVVVRGVEGLLALAAVGTLVCARRTVSACLAVEPEEDQTDRHVRSLTLKLASPHWFLVGEGITREAVTRDEMDALEGMARERKSSAVWRVF